MAVSDKYSQINCITMSNYLLPTGTPELSSPHKRPLNNVERIMALREHEVMSEPPKRSLNDITKLAAQLCDTPIARVTMVESDCQRFIAHVGSDQETAPIEDGFCPLVVRQGQLLIVDDAPASPLFSQNPMVVERGIRFYAGVPLVTASRYVIGAICVMDFVPRELSASQIEGLETLARQVMSQLELSLTQQKIAQASHTLAAVSAGMAAEVGSRFFPTLVQNITEALGVDYAYIALISANKPGMMETIAVCHQGKPADNFEYDLSKAPCFDVIEAGEFRYYERDLPRLYPEEPSISELGIEGYAAIPFMDVSGQPLGVLATMRTQALSNPEAIKALLTIFSVRISAELERQKDEAAQQDLLAREQAARGQAELASQMKDDFLAVVSHELRSPLNPIVGWAKLLRRGSLSPAKVDTALETIERNALLQVRLVDDLLDVSRILRGKLSLNKVPVKLEAVVTASIGAIRLEADRKHITIQQIDITGSSTHLLVLGDEVRLQQIFGNLLSNAVKFTPNNGHITVQLSATDRFGSVRVQDTGRGISAEFLPSVFKRFRQEDYSTTRHFGGLGLGLSIVQQLVKMHSGSVDASSPGEGQGATFTVTIPLMASP